MTNLAQGSGHQIKAAPSRSSLSHGWLRSVKASYTTRHVARLLTDDQGGEYRLDRDAVPQPGDVLLARVDAIGRHKRLESPDSRRAVLFPGDEILVAYGHRYAPDQFEAEVPPDLRATHLVAAGGVAGTVTTTYAGLEPPTEITPLGLLSGAGRVLNLAHAAPFRLQSDAGHRGGRHQDGIGPQPDVMTVAVVGTSMNSGKSTTLASLANGLSRLGLQVAAGKVTGTGAGGDARLFHDSGAGPVLDFTDFGYASTYRLAEPQVAGLMTAMLAELSLAQPDAILVEIADGLGQDETVRLLARSAVAGYLDRVVFAAADALGAQAGVQILASLGLEVAAVSGRFTSSPLAVREATALLPVKVYETAQLCDPEVAKAVLHGTG